MRFTGDLAGFLISVLCITTVTQASLEEAFRRGHLNKRQTSEVCGCDTPCGHSDYAGLSATLPDDNSSSGGTSVDAGDCQLYASYGACDAFVCASDGSPIRHMPDELPDDMIQEIGPDCGINCGIYYFDTAGFDGYVAVLGG
jgi:hypothetical protein